MATLIHFLFSFSWKTFIRKLRFLLAHTACLILVNYGVIVGLYLPEWMKDRAKYGYLDTETLFNSYLLGMQLGLFLIALLFAGIVIAVFDGDEDL